MLQTLVTKINIFNFGKQNTQTSQNLFSKSVQTDDLCHVNKVVVEDYQRTNSKFNGAEKHSRKSKEKEEIREHIVIKDVNVPRKNICALVKQFALENIQIDTMIDQNGRIFFTIDMTNILQNDKELEKIVNILQKTVRNRSEENFFQGNSDEISRKIKRLFLFEENSKHTKKLSKSKNTDTKQTQQTQDKIPHKMENEKNTEHKETNVDFSLECSLRERLVKNVEDKINAVFKRNVDEKEIIKNNLSIIFSRHCTPVYRCAEHPRRKEDLISISKQNQNVTKSNKYKPKSGHSEHNQRDVPLERRRKTYGSTKKSHTRKKSKSTEPINHKIDNRKVTEEHSKKEKHKEKKVRKFKRKHRDESTKREKSGTSKDRTEKKKHKEKKSKGVENESSKKEKKNEQKRKAKRSELSKQNQNLKKSFEKTSQTIDTVEVEKETKREKVSKHSKRNNSTENEIIRQFSENDINLKMNRGKNENSTSRQKEETYLEQEFPEKYRTDFEAKKKTINEILVRKYCNEHEIIIGHDETEPSKSLEEHQRGDRKKCCDIEEYCSSEEVIRVVPY